MSILNLSPSVSELEQADDWMTTGKGSHSVTFDRSDSYATLIDAYEDCRESNWDGYDAAPALIDAYISARRVLQGLPSFIPSPEIDVTPQGKILFEWYRAPRKVLTMTIGPTGEMAYALLSGRSKRSGTDLIVDFLPKQVLNDLQRLYS